MTHPTGTLATTCNIMEHPRGPLTTTGLRVLYAWHTPKDDSQERETPQAVPSHLQIEVLEASQPEQHARLEVAEFVPGEQEGLQIIVERHRINRDI